MTQIELIGFLVLGYVAYLMLVAFKEAPLASLFFYGGFIGGFALMIRMGDAGYGGISGVVFAICAISGIAISGRIE